MLVGGLAIGNAVNTAIPAIEAQRFVRRAVGAAAFGLRPGPEKDLSFRNSIAAQAAR